MQPSVGLILAWFGLAIGCVLVLPVIVLGWKAWLRQVLTWK